MAHKKLAIALGGILLAYRAFGRVATSLWQLEDAAISWKQVSTLFHAAARPEPVGIPLLRSEIEPKADALSLIEAQDLTFRYADRGEPGLRNCNFSIRPQDRILLQGHSGDGKSTLASLLSFRVRSRVSLELELIALRHQLIVLRRQRPRRLRLFFTDRLFWVWLYRLRPELLDALVHVKPATVIGWHRKGFRIYWRWQSRRSRRSKTNPEIRDLIRRMSYEPDMRFRIRLSDKTSGLRSREATSSRLQRDES